MSVAARKSAPLALDRLEPLSHLGGKASQVAALVADMRAEVDRDLADEITRLEAREALTRTTLTEAVVAALGHAAEGRATFRRTLEAHRSRPAPVSGRRSRQLHWRVRWQLARLGPRGQAQLIDGSGLWAPGQAGGRREIEAYTARRADPAATPASLFDQAWYLNRYPDVAGLNLSPLLHYLIVGQGEGRDPHPLFCTDFYTRTNADDLARDRAWALGHFLHAGSAALRSPHPLFDSVHYVSQGALPEPGEDLVSHYLREGWRRGLSPHPLFDPDWYVAQLPEGAPAGPPLLHYVLEGAVAGLSPHPLFEPQWYLDQAQDGEINPLRHYVEGGARDGHSPSRWFDAEHYAAQAGAQAEANPLIDYLQGGAWRVAEPTPGFATAAYVAANPELARQGLTPLEHWARAATERRQPN